MTKEKLIDYCREAFGTEPDCPFEEDFETTVLRHRDSRKWYGIIMKIPRKRFGIESEEAVDVVNVKLPVEMFGSFGKSDGVYPAYHMNKRHLVSVILPDAADDLVEFLINVSFEATKTKNKKK